MSGRKQKKTGSLPADFIQGICNQLARNTRVRRKLPEYGRVHIDRQLPFLAVYRRPHDEPDPGTERLLLGEASYLLAQGRKNRDVELTSLLKDIVRTQKEVFSAFLVLEVWAAEDESADIENAPAAQPPAFTLYAPKHDAPATLLEAFENTLLDIEVSGQKATVSLRYEEGWAPPGLKPLLTRSEIRQLGCILLGLQVRPIYRDATSGALFPFILRTLHHALAHALKRTFHTFAHTYTTHRPAHYHELGRRAMTSAVWETDRRLTGISSSFDILLHVTPINTEAAFAEFKRRRFAHMPEFLYRPRQADPALLKRQLYQIPLERIEDPTLAHIFAAKRDELNRQLSLIEDRGTSRFLFGSLSIYGKPEERLLQLAKDILERLPPHTHDAKASHYVDANEFARLADAELSYYRQLDPGLAARVELRSDIPGVMVSRGNLLVSRHIRVPAARVMATLSHEVGTHILTYHNGYAQPFQQLRVGMANYEALQEGLAVLAEYLVGELGRPRLRLLAGRVVAVEHITQGASFIETYRELHDSYGFNQSQAFMITMRVYRGGGYIKDVIYLRGLVALLDHLKTGGDLELLYLGKIAQEHIPFIEELCWRKVLKTSLLRPRFLDEPQAAPRRKRLGQGLSVLELLEDVK